MTRKNGHCQLHISIPSGITTLGADIFSGCTALETVELGSVESIGERAFNGTAALKSIKIPASVKVIGADAFDQTSGIQQILCEANEEPVGWSISWSYNTELAIYSAK